MPGILGSALHYPRQPAVQELWTENLLGNYKLLLQQPSLLHWNGVVAHSRLIKRMSVSSKIPWPQVDLYEGLIQALRSDSELGRSPLLDVPTIGANLY